MKILTVLGWIVWAAVLLYGLWFAIGIRRAAQRRVQGPLWPTLILAWVLVALPVVFLFLPFSKLHMLWLLILLWCLAQVAGIAHFPVVSQLLVWPAYVYARIVAAGTGATLTSPSRQSPWAAKPGSTLPLGRVCVAVLTGLLHNRTPEEKAIIGTLAESRYRALLEAAEKGLPDEVRSHLERGADVNAREPRAAWTALHHAAWLGNKEMAEVLVAHGADVNAADKSASTPLHGSAYKGHVAVLELLIASGADPNASDANGWTPLHRAAQQGHVDAAEALVSARANLNAATVDGATPLHTAANEGHYEVIELLVAHGADVDARSCTVGGTPLHGAAVDGHVETVRVLLGLGADAEARDKDGWTPLHAAAQTGNTEVVELLLDAGADVNARDNPLGLTPLLMAVERGLRDVAAALIVGKADVNLSAADSLTPLHRAAFGGDEELVARLISAGADPHARDDSGATPLAVAELKGHHGVARLLRGLTG